MDVEIGAALDVQPTTKTDPAPSDICKFPLGKIYSEHWSVAYNSRDGDTVTKKLFFLRDKHLFKTSSLEKILDMIQAYKGNSESDKKCFADMLKWYLVFRKTLLNLMNRLYRVVKVEQ